MKTTLLAFGIVKELFKSPSVEIILPENATVADLKSLLNAKYPNLKQIASYMIAVNNEYVADKEIIHENDEIAIIPPVSGG